MPAPRRGEILMRFARVLEREKDALTDLMTREMGKVKAEAGGDVQEAIDMTYYMAGEGRRMWGQTTPSELRDKFNMSVRVPVGVVGAITPWNFPIAIPSWKLAPALICGNTVVLKPAEDTPLAGGALRRAARGGRRARRASSTSCTATARPQAMRSCGTRAFRSSRSPAHARRASP